MTGTTKDNIKNRFKRSEGQLNAIIKMIDNETDPKQVMIQISALLSSLENAKIQLIEEYTRERVLKAIEGISDLLK